MSWVRSLITPWHLSVALNLCVLVTARLTTLGRREIGPLDIVVWIGAAGFGYTCWRIFFDHVPGTRNSRVLGALTSLGFMLYVIVAFVSIGVTHWMGFLPDAPALYFVKHNPSYAAHMIVDRLDTLQIVSLLVVLGLALYAVTPMWRVRRDAGSRRIGWLPALLGLLLAVPLAVSARAQYGLESNFFMLAGQIFKEMRRPPALDRFVLARPRLDEQKCGAYLPNIVFFQLEEISFERFGRAANGQATDPFLKDLSERDPRHFHFLENHYTNSGATEVSLYTMMVGLDAAQDGRRLGRMPMVWDYLKACGYTTLYSVPFDLGWAGLADRLKRSDGTSGLDYQFDTTSKRVPFDYEISVKDERAVNWFLETLPEITRKGKPFFAVINLQASHFLGGGVSILGKNQFACGRDGMGFDAYECGVYEADVQIRRVMTALSELGLREDTVVMGTPDHGADLKGRRTRLESFYQEVVHVPFFVFLPERLLLQSPEFVVRPDKLTQHADVVPTILQIVGFQRDAKTSEFLDALTGVSIFSPVVRRAVFFVNVNALRDWRRYGFGILYEGRLKYIFGEGKRELYDLRADPDEQHNLIGQRGFDREAVEITLYVERNTLLRTVEP